MSALLFILLTLVVFSLPLIPAVHEFLFKTDVAPLEVPVGYDIDPRRFAYNFRKMVYGSAQGYLSNGAPIQAVNGERACKAYDPQEPLSPDENAREILVSRDKVLVGRGAWMHNEVYSSERVRCRTSSHVRAVFSEQVLALGSAACVTRWAHGEVVYAVDKNELYGRITAESMIHIRNRAVFERLHAPVIRFGDRHGLEQTGRRLPARVLLDASRCGPLLMHQPELHRLVFEGNVSIPSNSIVNSDIVVRGDLRIGDNVCVNGSVKARGKMSIGHDSVITGSAVAQESLLVGRRAHVFGPTIGELRVVLGNDSRVGNANALATVTSARIDIHSGVVVHGSIWAREFGRAVGKLSRRSR